MSINKTLSGRKDLEISSNLTFARCAVVHRAAIERYLLLPAGPA